MTADRLTRLIAEMETAGSAVVVMSPHLDDAVLSCGALLAHLAARHRVTVTTVFTAAAPPPVVAARPQATARARRGGRRGPLRAAPGGGQGGPGRDRRGGGSSGVPGRLVPPGPEGTGLPDFPVRCRPRPGRVLRRRAGRRGERPGGRDRQGGPGRGDLRPPRRRPPRRPPDHPPGRAGPGEGGPDRVLQRLPLLPDGRARAGLRPAGGPGPASLAGRAGREREPDRRIPDPVRRVVP